MNKEGYQKFAREYEELSNKAREILKCITKGHRSGFSIDSINFDEDSIEINYSETVMGCNYPEFVRFPAHLLYASNWEEQYQQWSLEEKKKAEARESLQKQEQAKKERQERLKQYQKLKKEFETER